MKIIVKFALVDELRMFGIDSLCLDRHLHIGLGVDGLVDLSEGALSDLLDDLKVLAHLFELHVLLLDDYTHPPPIKPVSSYRNEQLTSP